MQQIGWQRGVKCALDRSAAVVGLVVTSPILLAASLAIRASMGGPILFRQQRPGLHGEPFVVLKFRTMRDAHDADGRPLPDDQRLTRLGRFLRATSIDELPQLLNVVRGELSLVGPRPLLMRYLSRYSPQQSRRHEVMPGMTGWAQVHGRNAIAWPEKLAHDVWYVDHWTLLVDLHILTLTLFHVLRRTGVARAGHATMPEFLGEA